MPIYLKLIETANWAQYLHPKKGFMITLTHPKLYNYGLA